MRLAITLLICITPLAAQTAPVLAKRVAKPIPHWSCAAGTFPVENPDSFIAPNCIVPHRGVRIAYDIDTQEAILFEKDITITEQGTVTVIWESFWVAMPGCAWTGDEKDHIEIKEQTKEKLVVSGKAGLRLHAKCQGIINRDKQP